MDNRRSARAPERPHAKSVLPMGLGQTSGSHVYQRTLDERRIRHSDRWRRQCRQLDKWLLRGEEQLQRLAVDVAVEQRSATIQGRRLSHRSDLAGRHVASLIGELQTLSAELDTIENRAAGRLFEYNGDRPWHSLRDASPSVGRRRALCRTIIDNLVALSLMHRDAKVSGTEAEDKDSNASLGEIQARVDGSLAAIKELKSWLRSTVPDGGEPLVKSDRDEDFEGLM